MHIHQLPISLFAGLLRHRDCVRLAPLALTREKQKRTAAQSGHDTDRDRDRGQHNQWHRRARHAALTRWWLTGSAVLLCAHARVSVCCAALCCEASKADPLFAALQAPCDGCIGFFHLQPLSLRLTAAKACRFPLRFHVCHVSKHVPEDVPLRPLAVRLEGRKATQQVRYGRLPEHCGLEQLEVTEAAGQRRRHSEATEAASGLWVREERLGWTDRRLTAAEQSSGRRETAQIGGEQRSGTYAAVVRHE